MEPEIVEVRESLLIQVLAGTPSPAPESSTVNFMDNRNDIREFLATRRATIRPEQTGSPAHAGNRRVLGLRRGEVATLAGMSVEYYTRLERGNLAGVSEKVLEALARALQLDDAERGHLFDLARAAGTPMKPRRRPAQHRIRPSVQFALDAINHARFIFLEEERARRFFPEWELAANRAVAMDLSADTCLSLLIYPAEPASASADALRLLASWAATQSRGEQSRATAAASEGA
jgi:transcriptional regulator with XRE-family HTH domain